MRYLILGSCIHLAFLLHSIAVGAPPPHEVSEEAGVKWARAFSAEQGAWAGDAIVAQDGYVLAGRATFNTDQYVEGERLFDSDMWLAKIDWNGNLMWSRTFGTRDSEGASALAQTSEGGYVLAGTASRGYDDMSQLNACVIKTDGQGNEVWRKVIQNGERREEAHAVEATPDGGCVFAGTTNPGENYEDADAWLMRLNGAGGIVWSRTFGGGDVEEAHALQALEDGGFAIAGMSKSFHSDKPRMYLVKTNTEGRQEWARTLGDRWGICHAVAEAHDGGIIAGGYSPSEDGSGRWDACLVKVDCSGNDVWARTFAQHTMTSAWSIERAAADGYIVTGWTSSEGIAGQNMALLAIDSDGNVLWSRSIGGTERDRAFSARRTPDGGYIVVGSTMSFGLADLAVLLVKTDSLGNCNLDAIPSSITVVQRRPTGTED